MFTNLHLHESPNTDLESSKILVATLAAMVGVIVFGLAWTLVVSNKAAAELGAMALNNLVTSGVENPVTAVLLNYRSYDTLLEVAVLMIVAFAMLPTPRERYANENAFVNTVCVTESNPVLIGLLRWLVPLGILIGGYLLWTGAYAPGGAFQAAAVIAGAGVALSLAGRHVFVWHTLTARGVIVVGLLVFIAVAVAVSFVTGKVLQYPVSAAGQLILMIELAATISITAILLLLFSTLRSFTGDVSAKERE